VNAYALAEWIAHPSLSLHAGLTAYRHEIFGSRITPRAALVWRASRSDTLKAVYTEGFRAPSASEAFFDDALDYIPNLRLRPETARVLEASWMRRLGGWAAVFASAFASDYGRLIRVETVPRPGLVGPPDPLEPSDFRQQARNGSDFTTRGLELGGRLRLSRWADAYGGVSWQRAQGDAPVNTAAITGNLSASTRALWRPLSLGLRAFLIGARSKDPVALVPGQPTRVPAQVRLDATAVLDVPGLPGLALEASALNLLDGRNSHPVANDFAPITQMAEAPPTVRIAIGYHP
jgi:outer membrane receptor protein involved in Fe transport